ncbi:F0F1 ATP synthase subunit A [Zavarzinia compransoris]|uniref:ATP synthase subunit a n=1 Tax=Zavarzinia compransoris TaxID=1264899 RepID=A0A317E8S6_9PROT|nr:F0F1 ATP synthase subunit A [Zavarzinia compransoris]PWR23527.1 F0F1 ATP synthase subunit A [Zavarzinia compransoris]TDP47738.1 ATP synthase F0 subcomplex A subunit [Zavarzinia compransoris]
MAAGGEAHGPLFQFEIQRLVPLEIGGIDISFTNSALWMVIIVAVATVFFLAATSRAALVPGRLQSVAELSYEFVAGLLRDNAGKEGMKYFPFIFTIFIFVLLANMLGMVPYSFTVTSHLAVTATMSLIIILGITVLGLIRHGFGFFHVFLPSGVPMWLAPLLIVIEVISYLTRPVSLAVRLFANMMAGHTTLKVFAGFVVALGVAGVVPLLFVVALTALEVLIAFLQAYIFTILTCIYLNDAFHPHH